MTHTDTTQILLRQQRRRRRLLVAPRARLRADGVAAHPARVPAPARHEGHHQRTRAARAQRPKVQLGRDVLAEVYALDEAVIGTWSVAALYGHMNH
ncbi:hypothetical protein MRB53_039556 [Persea americana]|nr:hypothetical protein MRB53_039556 [Persea americana]